MNEIRILQSRTGKDPQAFIGSFCSKDPKDLNRTAFAVLSAADGSLKDSSLAAEYTVARLTAFVQENEKAFHSMAFEELRRRAAEEALTVSRELSHIASVKGYSYRADLCAFLVIQNSFLCIRQGKSPAFVIDGPAVRKINDEGPDLSISDGILKEGSSLLITSSSLDSVIPPREFSQRLFQCSEKALGDMCGYVARRGIRGACAVMISSVRAASPKRTVL